MVLQNGVYKRNTQTDGQTLIGLAAMEVMTGETPDSSEFLEFDINGWVKYHGPHTGQADNVFLGKWLVWRIASAKQ
jgi:hypothetical protein